MNEQKQKMNLDAVQAGFSKTLNGVTGMMILLCDEIRNRDALIAELQAKVSELTKAKEPTVEKQG